MPALDAGTPRPSRAQAADALRIDSGKAGDPEAPAEETLPAAALVDTDGRPLDSPVLRPVSDGQGRASGGFTSLRDSVSLMRRRSRQGRQRLAPYVTGSLRTLSKLAPLRVLPFSRIVLAWLLTVSFLGGIAIWLAERGVTGIAFIDALYLAANGVTATGLSSVDVRPLGAATKVLMGITIQLGSSTMIGLVPVFIRIHRIRSLRSLLPASMDAVIAQRCSSQKVPQWLVEYRALCILVQVLLAYQATIYVVFGLAVFGRVAGNDGLKRLVREEAGVNAGAFAAFHTLSAYNNAGFSLQSASLVNFTDYPGLISLFGAVCLLGNVLLPVMVRWILIAINFCSKEGTLRKVYLRYLLLFGRDVYSHIFASQQTWILLITQLVLITVQFSITWWSSNRLTSFDDQPWGTHAALSLFESINTRHAGLTVFNLGDLGPNVLVLYIMMMFLAPVPFMVALRSSARANNDATPRLNSKPPSPAGPPPAPQRSQTSSAENVRRAFANAYLSPNMGRMRLPYSVSSSTMTSGAAVREYLAEQKEDSDAEESPRPPSFLRRPRSLISRALRRPRNFVSQASLESPPSTGPSLGYWASSGTESFRSDEEDRDAEKDRLSGARERLRNRLETGDWREEDYLTDTRVLLMVAYPREHVPANIRVKTRAKAVSWHLVHLVQDFATSTAARDLIFLWLAWYLVVVSESGSDPAAQLAQQFSVLFEIVSGYGNVGLSLGSVDPANPNASFSGNFSTFGKVVMLMVMHLGALRGLPIHVDSVIVRSDNRWTWGMRPFFKLREQLGKTFADGDPSDAEDCEEVQGNRVANTTKNTRINAQKFRLENVEDWSPEAARTLSVANSSKEEDASDADSPALQRNSSQLRRVRFDGAEDVGDLTSSIGSMDGVEGGADEHKAGHASPERRGRRPLSMQLREQEALVLAAEARAMEEEPTDGAAPVAAGEDDSRRSPEWDCKQLLGIDSPEAAPARKASSRGPGRKKLTPVEPGDDFDTDVHHEADMVAEAVLGERAVEAEEGGRPESAPSAPRGKGGEEAR